MEFTYDMKDIADYTLSFTVEEGEIQWFLGGIKKSNDFINEGLKSQLPKRKIFKINSLIYNVETQVKDVNISFDCSYNDENNTLSVIINENINHTNLTKEVALTLFVFVQRVQIEKLYLSYAQWYHSVKQTSSIIKFLHRCFISCNRLFYVLCR